MADSKDLSLLCEPVWKTLPEGMASQHFLTVDDTMRPKASSDPGSLHICVIPEITITGDDGTNGDCNADDSNSSVVTPFSRPRSNTCPEEMFQARKGRPPTPPPVDVHKIRNPAGKRFSFNFTSKDINVSFAHHRLSKVKEEKTDQQHKTSDTPIGLSSVCEDGKDSIASKCCQIKVDSISSTDVPPSHANACCNMTNTSSHDSCDVYAYGRFARLPGECSNSKTTNNNEIPIESNQDDSTVIGCTIGSCRS